MNFCNGKNELNLPPNKNSMKHILYAFFVLMSFVSFGQESSANAIIYSETGEKFRVYLNGELMNEDPLSNVKLFGLTSEFYQVNIDFVDASLGDFSSNMFAVKYGMEVTYRIKWTKKGYVLRYFSERSITTPEPNVSISRPIIVDQDHIEPEKQEKITQTQTTTTITNQKPQPNDSENVNINLNMNGVNVGVKVQNENQQKTTTTTTTTTTVTTTQTEKKSKVKPASPRVSQPSCFMEIKDFENGKASIQSKSFSESKMTLAKQITETHCLTSLQIKEITTLFDFETDRLTYATYAYDYCSDKQNYYIVNDAFQFESTIEELHKNISKKK